ncbi:MAG: LacI family DNA-binding transcriptional regulator, partial [Blautia hydrogenotrophica]
MTTIQDIADKLGISKGTVSKALNGASDISETLQKQILETAVELGYTKLRRQKGCAKKLCVLVENQNIEYEEPHHFAYDI